jgi:hypothetical protein
MGQFDEMWQRYSSGTRWKTILNRPALIVARDVPSDGVVPNERSLYPFRSSGRFFEEPPVVGSNHLTIYKTDAGVNTMRRAMLDFGMTPRP